MRLWYFPPYNINNHYKNTIFDANMLSFIKKNVILRGIKPVIDKINITNY